MKVLHVYRTYFPDSHGGLEEVIRQICLGTSAKGVTNRVFTLSDRPNPPQLSRPEADVIRVRKTFEIASCGFALTGLKSFAEQVDWADIVHYHYPWPFSDLLYFSVGKRKPAILTYHSDIVRQRLLKFIYSPLMDRYLSAMDMIIATSPNYFATSESLAKHESKVKVIPIGLNEQLRDSPGEDGVKLTRKIARYGHNFFLFVGVLRYYKGLHILLDAVRGADYKVVIVGSGPVEDELREQARCLGLTNVIFAGYISDQEKQALYLRCQAVVFPSYLRAEAFGVTLLEGAINSKPLISAEIGSGTSYVNIHNETGLVVPPSDSKALRAAMDKINQQPELAKRMGECARQRYESLFTGSVMGARYAEAYAQILEARSSSKNGENPS